MKTTAIQRRNDRMHAMFEHAREQDKADKKLPLQYAAGSIGNKRRGVVAMLPRGAWGYDDATGNLLAAAPDLLAACEIALAALDGAHDKLRDTLRGAIAHAKGEK
jgi:hypothetical protein